MKDLKSYTIDELYHELLSRTDVFSVQLWVREDIECAFEECEKDGCSVDALMADAWAKRSFDEGCTEECWEVLYAIVDQIEEE